MIVYRQTRGADESANKGLELKQGNGHRVQSCQYAVDLCCSCGCNAMAPVASKLILHESIKPLPTKHVKENPGSVILDRPKFLDATAPDHRRVII